MNHALKKHEPVFSGLDEVVIHSGVCQAVWEAAAGAVAGGEHRCEGQGALQGWGTLTSSHSCQICSRGGKWCVSLLQKSWTLKCGILQDCCVDFSLVLDILVKKVE